MTTNKDIYKMLTDCWASLEQLHLKVNDIVDKITFVPADEPIDEVFEGRLQEVKAKKPIEGGREEPDTAKHISKLEVGDTNVEFVGEIEEITDIKTYTRKTDNTEGRYQRFVIMDNTGNITITLWDAEIDKYRHCRVGDTVRVKAWQVSMYKLKKQAKLGKYGGITIEN